MLSTNASCCRPCTHGIIAPEEPTDPLTALDNFLPAGSLTLKILDLGDTHSLCCGQKHHSDGWHTYPGHAGLAGFVSSEDETTLKLLDFLSANHFLMATCRLVSSELMWGLVIRVYLIPFDLGGVKGSLRLREEVSVLTPARKYMRILLPLISRDICAWEGECDQGPLDIVQPLLDTDKVSFPTISPVPINVDNCGV